MPVAEVVARGEQVRVLIRRPDEELKQLGVEIAFGDLCEAAKVSEACRGVSTVYHVAAIAGIWGPWS